MALPPNVTALHEVRCRHEILGFDYAEHLFDPQKWVELKTYDFLQDRRDKKSENLINGEMSWNYLYTSCAIISGWEKRNPKAFVVFLGGYKQDQTADLLDAI